ncbi:hypothetical protein BDEG_23056 [Batrachochytrium dendrobatidis JEL423]|uniref:PPPDE domain-containing protein n=1 Tax=Batrachochytrium dendrobatidis (strain JEL423) TaxID=403673 RepID=A0A177WHC3_BATDL|nr:hypothetical protein BDEG_23056 [Batrachochytrium dendrobatidis JEL423]
MSDYNHFTNWVKQQRKCPNVALEATITQIDTPAAVLTEEEKQSIINAAKGQHKESIKSRRVEAVLVYGVVLYGKPPSFYSGWASGTTGHWGIVVDGLLHHLVFKLDEDRQPVGIKFKREDFEQEWIDEGKVTAKEEIGSTSLPLEAIKAVGESLILHFGDYRRLYRNCQTFADIFVQIVCDVDHKAFSSPSIQNVIATTLLAFPLTTVGGSIMHIKQKNFIKKVIKKTKKAISWEDIVDAEINDEINKIELGIVGSKTSCSLI